MIPQCLKVQNILSTLISYVLPFIIFDGEIINLQVKAVRKIYEGGW
jgi:hypothetical protein